MNIDHTPTMDRELATWPAVEPRIPDVTGDRVIDGLIHEAGRHLDATSTATSTDPSDIVERILHDPPHVQDRQTWQRARPHNTRTWAELESARGSRGLVGELKALRKGRALFAGHVAERVGPILRIACEVTDSDDLTAIRQKVGTRLKELAEHLPEDLRLATLAAFAIEEEARLPLYQDRVRWAAIKVGRDPRTVRRRVDEAIEQLAELATSGPRRRVVDPADCWHTRKMEVVMALDRAEPEVLERRRIIADQDGVRELDLAVSLPVTRRDLDVTVFYGGVLRDRGMESCDRLIFTLVLPRPLERGEHHDFAMRFQLPTVRPHMVCVPRHPCDLFDLRVRFSRDRMPARVWALQGAFQRDVTALTCRSVQPAVDQTGEIHMRFRHLTPGLAYGARWTPGH